MRRSQRYKDFLARRAQQGVAARLRKILESPAPDYPTEREPGEIIKRINGRELIVKLVPVGKCTQWRAVFPDGYETVGGMAKIDAEIRRRMPPLKG